MVAIRFSEGSAALESAYHAALVRGSRIMTSFVQRSRRDRWVARTLSAAAAALLAASLAHAHHSFSSIYDQSVDVALEGVVSEFRFIHPHPFLVIEIRDGNRLRRTLVAEMDNRFELEEIGITGTTFRRGDVVRINGSPGRRDPDAMYLWKLLRPADGLRYEQIGSTPHLARPDAPR